MRRRIGPGTISQAEQQVQRPGGERQLEKLQKLGNSLAALRCEHCAEVRRVESNVRVTCSDLILCRSCLEETNYKKRLLRQFKV